jgi:outer membrane lipoprotein carrier protein
MVRRVQSIGGGIVSNRMKSNSGSKASIASTIASAIAAAATGRGKWSVWLLSLVFLAHAHAAEIDVPKTLKGVETHYNTGQSLVVNFSEIYTARGHKRTEKGILYLHKPGKMRWQYTDPAGKLVVSDGKFIYYLDNNRAEKMPLKETDDMKAPLAFLLGKLHFEDDFKQITTSPDPRTDNIFITATPKSDRLPYTQVTFLVSADSVIHYLSVKGQDGSNLEYVFENEKKNAPLEESMFRFVPPPGVEYVTPSDNKR